MLHRDLYREDFSGFPPRLIERVEGERLEYYRSSTILLEKYREGYSNGYVYTTAEHEDGECARYVGAT